MHGFELATSLQNRMNEIRLLALKEPIEPFSRRQELCNFCVNMGRRYGHSTAAYALMRANPGAILLTGEGLRWHVPSDLRRRTYTLSRYRDCLRGRTSPLVIVDNYTYANMLGVRDVYDLDCMLAYCPEFVVRLG